MSEGVTILAAPFREGGGDSRALLLEAAAGYLGRSPGPMTLGPWGKPEFPAAPELFCSVSHSGSWWMCALGGVPLGLDLQLHRSQADLEKLSRRFFHPEEDAFLARDGYLAFFDLWSAKESWVKYTGRGFRDDPSAFSVAAGGKFPAVEGAWLRLLPFAPGYSLCLCAPSPCQVRMGLL